MKYIKTFSGMILISNIVFYSLIFTGCSVQGTFIPDEVDNEILLKFRDKPTVERICGENKVGCHQKINGIHVIYSVTEWCTFIHEMSHVIKGMYHEKGATCKVLPR